MPLFGAILNEILNEILTSFVSLSLSLIFALSVGGNFPRNAQMTVQTEFPRRKPWVADISGGDLRRHAEQLFCGNLVVCILHFT